MFIRSKAHPFGRQLSTPAVRALLTGLYTLYPLGCILQLIPQMAGGGPLLSIIGLMVMLAAIVCFLVLAGSSLQRQTQEPETLLDERELDQRNRAGYHAHSVFSGVVVAGILYVMLASDLIDNRKLDLWLPTTGDHWNAIFWGLILLSLTLPGAMIAFGKSAPDAE